MTSDDLVAIVHHRPFINGRRSRGSLGRSRLGNNRQCEVIAIAVFIVGLEVVAVAYEDRAVRQVAERAGNRIGRSVVNHSENGANVSMPVPTSTKVNDAPLLMVTPRAVISPAMRLLRFNTHLYSERELNVRALLMVRMPGTVPLLPGEMIAPELLPVPTVTAPSIMPPAGKGAGLDLHWSGASGRADSV